VPKRPPTVHSPKQTGWFLAVAAEDRLAAMWVLLVTSGMRPSEVLGPPWAAVDLENGVLSIYQKLIKVENRAVLADGTKVDRTGAAIAQVIVLARWPPRCCELGGQPSSRNGACGHGWATAALRAGVHPKLVQEVMGPSYSTTADTYTHVMPPHSAEAVRTVAALFEKPSRLILSPTPRASDEA
jgi:integrase